MNKMNLHKKNHVISKFLTAILCVGLFMAMSTSVFAESDISSANLNELIAQNNISITSKSHFLSARDFDVILAGKSDKVKAFYIKALTLEGECTLTSLQLIQLYCMATNVSEKCFLSEYLNSEINVEYEDGIFTLDAVTTTYPVASSYATIPPNTYTRSTSYVKHDFQYFYGSKFVLTATFTKYQDTYGVHYSVDDFLTETLPEYSMGKEMDPAYYEYVDFKADTEGSSPVQVKWKFKTGHPGNIFMRETKELVVSSV